jgi:hypothetical protein
MFKFHGGALELNKGIREDENAGPRRALMLATESVLAEPSLLNNGTAWINGGSVPKSSAMV